MYNTSAYIILFLFILLGGLLAGIYLVTHYIQIVIWWVLNKLSIYVIRAYDNCVWYIIDLWKRFSIRFRSRF